MPVRTWICPCFAVTWQLAMRTCDHMHKIMHTKRGLESRLLQDNVALIVVLDATAGQGQGQEKPAEAPRRQLICVANTHIHANPELNDVKLWQVNAKRNPRSAHSPSSIGTVWMTRGACFAFGILQPHTHASTY